MTNKPIKNYPGLNPPNGYKLNPFSNNWIHCPDPKVINPETGRCVNPDSKTLKKSVVSSSKKVSPKPSKSTKKISPKSTKKKETIMQKILKDYMMEISQINKLAGKKSTSYKSKSKSKKNRSKKRRHSI